MSIINEVSSCNIDEYGNKHWRLPNGDLHRENNLPAVERTDGTKKWFINGKLHRENDLPAIEYADGDKCWYVNGLHHRVNGPAYEYADGCKYWHLEGVRYSEEEYNEKVKDYKVETIPTQENNSYSQGYKDDNTGLKWL